MSSSTESEEEDLSHLTESVDSQLFKEDLYKSASESKANTGNNNANNNKEELPPSLRRNAATEDDSYNFFKVTPEFQKYVSKCLSRILDQQLLELISVEEEQIPCKPKKRDGIKLLRTSKKFLRLSKETAQLTEKKCARKNNELNEEEILEQCRSVAISPEEILSKKSTQFWSNRYKQSKFFSYVQNSEGKLILTE